MRVHAKLVITDNDEMINVDSVLESVKILKKWVKGEPVSLKSSKQHDDFGIVMELYKDSSIEKDIEFIDMSMEFIKNHEKEFEQIRSKYPKSDWQLSLFAKINDRFSPVVNLDSVRINLLFRMKISFDLDLST